MGATNRAPSNRGAKGSYCHTFLRSVRGLSVCPSYVTFVPVLKPLTNLAGKPARVGYYTMWGTSPKGMRDFRVKPSAETLQLQPNRQSYDATWRSTNEERIRILSNYFGRSLKLLMYSAVTMSCIVRRCFCHGE